MLWFVHVPFWRFFRTIKQTWNLLGTLPDIAANARPLRAWLKYRTITTHALESLADLSRNCKGFRSRESVHARVTESRAQGTGVGRDIRQSPSRVRSVFLLIYAILILYWLSRSGRVTEFADPNTQQLNMVVAMRVYSISAGRTLH